jgi:hypothetical protein
METDGLWQPPDEALPIDRVRTAASAYQLAKVNRRVAASRAAEDELRTTIHSVVYDQGVSWQSIADALGIARGIAYQRFRRSCRDEPATSTPKEADVTVTPLSRESWRN